jgi:hypothetical protein
MSNEIEKDYDSVLEEMCDKIDQATKLLTEAGELGGQAGINVPSYDDWEELQGALQDILPSQAKRVWNTPASNVDDDDDDGWYNSGCSF